MPGLVSPPWISFTALGPLLDQLKLLINQAQRCIQYCIKEHNMTKQETVGALFTIFHIPPFFTQSAWQTLERENPEFFQAYYARLELMHRPQNAISISTEHMLSHVQNGTENTTLNGAQNGTLHQNGGEYTHQNQQPRVNNGSSIQENGVDAHQRVNGRILANGGASSHPSS